MIEICFFVSLETGYSYTSLPNPNPVYLQCTLPNVILPRKTQMIVAWASSSWYDWLVGGPVALSLLVYIRTLILSYEQCSRTSMIMSSGSLKKKYLHHLPLSSVPFPSSAVMVTPSTFIRL